MPAAPSATCEATYSPDQLPVITAQARANKPHDAHRRRIVELFRRMVWTSYSDPLFEQPHLVEDDYYRFINQPRGW